MVQKTKCWALGCGWDRLLGYEEQDIKGSLAAAMKGSNVDMHHAARLRDKERHLKACIGVAIFKCLKRTTSHVKVQHGINNHMCTISGR